MRRLLPLAAVAAALAAALPMSAGAAQPKFQAQVLGPITSQGDTAQLTVRYTCAEGDHLWVSTKQSPSGAPDQRLREEGSSQYAAAILHSHRNPVDCDGAWHTQTFTVDKEEWGWGQLQPGSAWVQWCLTSESALLISHSGWAAVR